MRITEIDKFDVMLKIPENESDKDNDLFLLTIKEKNLFFFCISVNDNHDFVMFSTSFELCKRFNDNEITIGEAISADSEFYSLKLSEDGVQYFENENNINIDFYDFNYSDIIISDSTIFNKHQNITHILDANIECFY